MSSYQYYPTGAHTAARMYAKFKRPVNHLCDPSAGKGHLIRHAREGFVGVPDADLPWLADIEDRPIGRNGARVFDYARKRFGDVGHVSAVEIDARHHDSLKELDIQILGYDFMDVQSLATVTSVLMNPPFARGEAHVLHAWEVVYDAEIVAIINAESIRNPRTQERQRLVELIAAHGTVEFLRDQFIDDVERKTEVEVALIYLEKTPARYMDLDRLLGGLTKGDALRGEIEVEVCTALSLPSNFIQDTSYRFRQAVAAARAASEAVALADHFAEGMGLTLDEMQAKGVGSDFRTEAGNVRAAANEDFKVRYDNLKKRAWGQILRSSLLNDRLSNQARRKVEASAESIYAMEFSVANIHGFLAGVIQSLPSIYEDMIVDLFDAIIERSSDNVVFYRSWKSNQKHRIGMRIRKSRFIMPRFQLSFGGSLDYESERFLADVDKVWGYLMGEPHGYDGLVAAMKKSDLRSSERIASRYFDVRYYKGVQTLHFYPKSSEVVEKINKFVGKLRQWIPGNMDEANSDFQKQYEGGEALTKDYMRVYEMSARNSYGYDRPAIALLRNLKGKDEGDTLQLDRLSAAVDMVHTQRGLHCGPALTTSHPVQSICMGDQPHSNEHSRQEQLLLLAA